MLAHAHNHARARAHTHTHTHTHTHRWANGPLRWLTLMAFPLADIFLYVIPTIHAHTKMFLTGGSFNYIPSAKQGERRPAAVAAAARGAAAPGGGGSEGAAGVAKDQHV